jgi:hypothetical protein
MLSQVHHAGSSLPAKPKGARVLSLGFRVLNFAYFQSETLNSKLETVSPIKKITTLQKNRQSGFGNSYNISPPRKTGRGYIDGTETLSSSFLKQL